MANHRSQTNRPRGARRRRPSGVPVMLVIVLMIIALLMGALGGYFIARKTDTHIHELKAANDRITELENTLTLIGYPVGDDVDPEQWGYDHSANDSALADLTGEGWDDDEGDVWTDDSLIDATLPEDSEPVVVAEFEGGQLMSNEVIAEYNDQLTTQIFAGHSAEEVAEETLDRVLRQLTGDKIIALRAAELGLTELDDGDLARIRQEATENYEAQLEDFIALSGASGESRDDAARRLEEESGVTLESVTESVKQGWWARKYFEHIVQDVTVSDDEVRAHYDALLASQREAYDAYPEDFEYAHLTGQVIVYRPEGYRAVRDILIPFNEEDAAEVARLTEQIELGTAEEGAQERLDALYAPLEKKAGEAQKKLEAGEDFAALMDEYGCDAALKSEPMRSQGYYIGVNSFVNSVEYVEGSLMLEEPGQVSVPLRSLSGVHLVQYIGELAPGEVPFEEVAEAVAADALKQKQEEYYAQQREALLEAAQVKYYPERLR